MPVPSKPETESEVERPFRPSADERKPYTAPSVQYMGTLKDIIQFNNLGLNPDGDPSGFGFS